MKVIVVGSSNTEMILKAPRIPAVGDIVLGSAFSMSPGGRGVKQAIAASRAGGDVVFIGRIGNDLFGEQTIDALKQDNINTEYVIRDKHVASGVSSVVIDSHGDSAITITPGANANLSEKDFQKAKNIISPGDIMLIQLDIPIDVVRYAAGIAYSMGIRVILNPAPALPISDELLKSISILTPDAPQAEILTGITITDERSAELAGRILLERGLNRVIITLRSKGAMVIDNGGAEHVPGFDMSPVDNSMINDAFNGALVVALAEGKNFYESVLFANAAASISASRAGSIASVPYRNEIVHALKTAKRTH
jgi:ribokinase